jgi:anti-sigma B factor antagonist
MPGTAWAPSSRNAKWGVSEEGWSLDPPSPNGFTTNSTTAAAMTTTPPMMAGSSHRGLALACGGETDKTPQRVSAQGRNFNRLRPGAFAAGVLSAVCCRAVNLDLETSKKGDVAIISLRGEIDVYTAPRLRQALIDLVEGGSKDIVVDMDKVDFLDSTGLGVLVGGLKRVKSNDGEMKLVVTQDRIMKIFDITGLAKVFPMFGSLDEATGQPADG